MRKTIMNNNSIILCVLALTALLAGIAFAQDGDAGQSGELLRSGIGARSYSMGRAYTVMPTGGDGIVWNPAGLGKLGRWELQLMHAQGYIDSRLEFVSFAIPIGKLGGFGLGFANEGVSAIDGRDEFNRPTEELSWGESVFILGWGRAFMQNKFYAGLTGKYVMQNLGDESAAGLGGFDVGIISKDIMFKYRVALVAQNLGASEINGDAYPMTIRAGLGYRALRSLYITADGEMVSGRGISPRIGAEYQLGWLSLRTGFDVMKPEFTFGLGLAIDNFTGRIAGTYPRLDYAGAALGPIGMNYAKISLTVMGEEMMKLEDVEGDPCAQLSSIEPHMTKRGYTGAKANLIYGGCRFKAEVLDAPLSAEPKLGDVFTFFHEAYYGKYGSDWPITIVTDSLASTIFSQRTHYMYAETRMAKGFDDETKTLVEDLISAGGNSTQYDIRLLFDLARVQEELGETEEAISAYKSIGGRGGDDPEKVLALYRGALLIRDSDRPGAKANLEKLVNNYGYGFWDESGNRLSYPMFPKYKDNSVADDATILLADLIFSSAGGDQDEIRRALGLYLDVLIFYPDMEISIRKEAAEKAAICYDELGDGANASIMRERAGTM